MNKLLVFFVLSCLALSEAARLAEGVECPTAPSSPGDRRTNKNIVRIASYNAEWLFTEHAGGSSACPGTGCPWTDEASALEHLHNIARVIYELNADIINLVEVEDCIVLNELIGILEQLDSSLQGKYKPYLIQGTDSATGQDVGLITKIDPSVNLQRTENRVAYPIAGSHCMDSAAQHDKARASTSGVSKHYYTTIDIPGIDTPVLFVGAHLLAFPDDVYRCQQREAQASVLQQVIKAQGVDKHYEVIVMGDLNDFDPNITDPANSRPISQVLDILKNPDSSNTLFNSVSSMLLKENRYSAWWDKDSSCNESGPEELSLIDHVLISQGLHSKLQDVSIFHLYRADCTSHRSDHWPVVIQLDTSK
mmetsp:Transcript_16917/g.23541  ORF Transcript_16917/g.23541 Transcript_16917/m.23541 type:complete len:364 (-) Transcript_16917:50-1141(-)